MFKPERLARWFYAGFAGLSCAFMLCACAEDMAQESEPKPQSYQHDPLQYRAKVKYLVTFRHAPRDPEDAEYVIDEFQSRLEADGNNGKGYEIADGVEPNLTLNITLDCDNSNNKTMDVYGAVSDGYFHTSTNYSYQDSMKMVDAMADEVNRFVADGWHGMR